MAGLVSATKLTPSEAGWSVALDPAWDIWGPAGGYLAAIALRAVREQAPIGHRPVTLTGQFVRVAKAGTLDVTINPIKSGASALNSVRLSQDDQLIFQAQIWTTTRRDASVVVEPDAPDVPDPDGLPDQQTIAAERNLPLNKFWQNFDSRPVNFRTFDETPASVPNQYRWMRFADWSDEPDPFFDAMRTALLIDLAIWPGHWHRITEPARYLAPSLDLTVYFHTDAPAGEWLLSDADTDISSNGLLSGRARVWHADGKAIASGGGHQLVMLPKNAEIAER